jgi:uncharacterized membrane protein HdeD (DUF308 family)
MAGLVRNWWMMAARGGLAILFGLALLLWPTLTLSIVVVLFAAYAILDGLWAVGAGFRAAAGPLAAWPVVLEGALSVALGVLAVTWPFVSREFIHWIAGWGIVTGVLELVTATALPRESAEPWLLGMGGASSLFLGLLILLLPFAAVESVALLLGIYALVFGALLCLGAVAFRQRRGARPASPVPGPRLRAVPR